MSFPLGVLWFGVLSGGAAELPDALKDLVVTAEALEDGEVKRAEPLAVLAGGRMGQEIFEGMPNSHAGAGPGSAMALRGLTQDGSSGLGTRSNISIPIVAGGLPRSTNTFWAAGLPLWDAGEVELARGPVLFGTGTVGKGGELRVEPNAPVFAHEGRLLGEVGEYGSYRMGLTENVVLVEDKLALRFNAFREGTDGSVENVTLDDDAFEAIRKEMLRGQLRWRPAGDERSLIDLLVESEWMGGNSMGLSPLPLDGSFPREVTLNRREKMTAERHGVALRGRVDLEPGRWLEGEVGFQNANGWQLMDLDRQSWTFTDWFYEMKVDERRWNGGARWHGRTEEASWTLGMYGESSDYAAFFTGVAPNPFLVPPGVPFESRVREEVEIAALYATSEKRLAGDWWVSGGVRLDHQRRKQWSRAEFSSLLRGTGDVRVESTEWLPELGVEWRRDQMKVGAKVSRSYRPAGAAYAATLGTSEAYGAERGWEGNLYAERQWKSDKAEVRAFYAKMEGMHLPFVAAGGTPMLDNLIANAGRSTRGGVEAEVEWRGPGHLLAGLSGGYLYTNFDELTVNGRNLRGADFPLAPEWNAAVKIAWAPPEGWFGESALSWSDVSYSQLLSRERTSLEKRLLLSARAGYRWKQAEAYVFGSNLLNEEYALSRLDYTQMNGQILGKAGMPRLVGVGFSLHW